MFILKMLVAIIGGPTDGDQRQVRMNSIERLADTIPGYDNSKSCKTILHMAYWTPKTIEGDITTRYYNLNTIIDLPSIKDIPPKVRRFVDVWIMTDKIATEQCLRELGKWDGVDVEHPGKKPSLVEFTFNNDSPQPFVMFDRLTGIISSHSN